MRSVNLSKQAEKFLTKVPVKHARQIARKILELRLDPLPSDIVKLHGYPFSRADSGEYRIIFTILENTLLIEVIGKRNDSAAYQILRRR